MTMRAGEPRSGLLWALCLLLVACVYIRALGGPFIWDDRHLIGDSVAVRDSNQAFRQPFWLGEPGQSGSLAYYRPLTSVLFVIDRALYGDNSSGFHLSNLLLHLLAVSLLFGLLKRRGAGGSLAFLLVCGWALLPRLTEDVAWISGRGDLLVTVVTLAALRVYRPASALRFFCALLLALLALLAKESGIAVLVALLMLELSQASPRDSLARRYRFALLSLPLGLYVALRYAAGAFSLGDGLHLGKVARLLASLEALGRYAFMLVNPLQPRSLLGQLGQVDWLFAGLGAVALVGLVFALSRWRRMAPETLALVGLALVSIGLVLHLAPLPLTVVSADRYLYLPSAALLLALAPTLAQVSGPRVLSALVAFAVVCGARTFERVGDYVDEAQFWSTALQTAPRNATAYIELGSVAYRGGLFTDASSLSLKAVSMGGPHRGLALDNAALAAVAAGDRAQAARLGDELVRAFPGKPAFELRRAVIALNAHDFANAEYHLRAALVLAPDFAPARSFSDLLARARAAAADPSVPLLAAQRLDIETLRYAEIIARLDRLLELPPGQDPTLLLGLEFMIANGQPTQARELYDRYAKRGDAATNARLAAALAVRLEGAANIRKQLERLGDYR